MSTLDVYARISDDRTGQRAGVNRQVSDTTELVEGRGHSVGEVHVDNDIPATNKGKRRRPPPRPGFEAMITRVESGAIEGFAAFHTDRLYREPRELEDMIDLIEGRDLEILTCEGDFNLNTTDGQAMARVVVTMAKKETDDKKRRLVAMHRHRAAAGQISGGGIRPFGYESDRVTVRLDEAALIREAVERVLAGDSLHSIVADWRRSGVATVTGAGWQTTTLKRLLCSGRIAGLREHNGAVVRDEDGNPVSTVWPAIISPEQSSRLRAILRDPDRDVTGLREPTRYLLHGIIVCGRCEVPMIAMPVKRKGITYRRYHCRATRGGCDRNGISAERIEEQVAEIICALLADRQARSEAQVAGEEQRLLDGISASEAELKEWADELANQQVTRMAYKAAARAIETRVEGLRRQLRRERLRLVVVDLGDEPWEDMGFDQRRRAIEYYIERINIAPTTKANNRYDPTRWLPGGIVWRNHD